MRTPMCVVVITLLSNVLDGYSLSNYGEKSSGFNMHKLIV